MGPSEHQGSITTYMYSLHNTYIYCTIYYIYLYMSFWDLPVEALLPIPAVVVLAGAVAWLSGGCLVAILHRVSPHEASWPLEQAGDVHRKETKRASLRTVTVPQAHLHLCGWTSCASATAVPKRHSKAVFAFSVVAFSEYSLLEPSGSQNLKSWKSSVRNQSSKASQDRSPPKNGAMSSRGDFFA